MKKICRPLILPFLAMFFGFLGAFAQDLARDALGAKNARADQGEIAAAGSAPGGGPAPGPAAKPNPGGSALVAGELRLVDETGRTRLLMTLVRGKPRLFMLDEGGEYRLEMGLGADGEPHVWLRDSDGASKVQLALSSRGIPSLTLADQNKKERAVLALSKEGEPTLIMRDNAGKDRVAIWRNKSAEGMALADKNGKPILMMSAEDGERAVFDIY
ncbi:MAG: hypothetical protein LBF41_04745 [Deltaproteobacteria bacterium]|jgi:hypothetical protein|nr:hypothetical protein [Deltaproteobacteria bacterium]